MKTHDPHARLRDGAISAHPDWISTLGAFGWYQSPRMKKPRPARLTGRSPGDGCVTIFWVPRRGPTRLCIVPTETFRPATLSRPASAPAPASLSDASQPASTSAAGHDEATCVASHGAQAGSATSAQA
jgi:hypothetical protein